MFQKQTVISVVTKIIAVLIQNLSKSFRNVWLWDSMLKSFKNQFKKIKETDSGQD